MIIILDWYQSAQVFHQCVMRCFASSDKFMWRLAVVKVVIRNGKIFLSSYPKALTLMLFWCSNFPISFMSMGYWIPDMFKSCSYCWYFETLSGLFLHCTGCNDAKMDHKKHFSSSFSILRQPCFALSFLVMLNSWMLSCNRISPALRRRTKFY